MDNLEDDINFKILLLKIENYELQVLYDLKKKEVELVKQLITLQENIKLQKLKCKECETNFLPIDFKLDY